MTPLNSCETDQGFFFSYCSRFEILVLYAHAWTDLMIVVVYSLMLMIVKGVNVGSVAPWLTTRDHSNAAHRACSNLRLCIGSFDHVLVHTYTLTACQHHTRMS